LYSIAIEKTINKGV